MTSIVHIELDVPATIDQGYHSSTCRQVLMSDIHDKMYEGDFTSLLESKSVDSALYQVYTKILRLVHQVGVLKRIRNSFASINLLPAEILLRIFHCCTLGSDRSEPCWLAFSQVCTSWRRLALEAPSLWTNLDYEHAGLARLMLSRTQLAPLTVVGCSSESRQPLPDRNRILSLTLPRSNLFETPDETGTSESCLVGQYPILQSLHLTSPPSYYVTRDFTALDAPRLQHLYLHNVVMRNWAIPIVDNLTTLSLTYCMAGPVFFGGRDVFTLSVIVGLLNRTPRLTSLELHGLIGTLPSPELANDGIPIQPSLCDVTLLHLKKLYLHEDISTACCLLPHLHIPVCTEFILHCDLCGPSMESYIPRFPHLVNELLHRARWPVLHRAELHLSNSPTLTLGSKDLRTSNSAPAPAFADTYRLDIKLHDLLSSTFDTAASFLESLPSSLLRGVTFIQVRTEVTRPISAQSLETYLSVLWTQLSTLPTLQVIDFENLGSDLPNSLLLALGSNLPTTKAMAKEPEASVSFYHDGYASLHSLILGKMDLAVPVDDVPALEYLGTLLDLRSQQLKPISVVIANCNLPPALDVYNLDRRGMTLE